MVQRALAVCSTYSLLSTEFDKIREIGKQNGYPLSFINTRIGIGLGKYMKNTTTPNPSVIGCDKKRMYVEIPYIGKTTPSLKNKKLSHISGKLHPDVGVRFFAKPPPSVQSFFQAKDPIPQHLQSNVVYSIRCNDCGNMYVGKIDRQVITRMQEHGAPKSLFKEHNFLCLDHDNSDAHEDSDHDDIANTTQTKIGPVQKGSRVKALPYPDTAILRRSSRIRTKTTSSNTTIIMNKSSTESKHKGKNTDDDVLTKSDSTLSRHEQQTSHQVDWKGFKVVCRDTNPYRLLLKESLVIKAYQPLLNNTTHSVPLIVFPAGLPTYLIPDLNREKATVNSDKEESTTAAPQKTKKNQN